MKKIIFFLILISYFGFGQKQPSIQVIGRAVHIDKTPMFKGSVTLSSAYSSLPSETFTLSQMKEKYDAALKSNGISLAQLKEDKFAYESLGYDKEGTIYEFETSTLEDFRKFMKSKSFGVQRLQFDQVITLDEEEIASLSKKAFENAKKKAEAMTKNIELDLGKVISIDDNRNYLDEEIIRGLYYDKPLGHFQYEVVVTFALKND
ncbi:hypothetical protein HME9304_01620 [Flagellimonas maritima]|uniref:DUF541 domain-containing protein n=1 Tax=Flagellimonas maritima TaxID=1383885 RepID=A0A2Z4LTK1_9FLAO|nr:SIMPL domain-containing protein [Allomuricauda aurantiaca]AWX44617.1 hypothetical protein HME9304_01620 [Allomuricauda aurantiaca]